MVFCIAASLHAQSTGQIEFTIRYYDKAIYFSNSTVQVKLEFFNDTPDPVRFKIAENRFYSVDFDVRSMKNVPAVRSRDFVISRTTDEPVFFREVSLQPGERFGFVETLNLYVHIPGPGLHILQAVLFPELYRSDSSDSIVSNALTLTIHPGSTESSDDVAIDIETGIALAHAALPPDEVVDFLLTARQQSDMNKFLLYIDVERLFTRTPTNYEQYRRLSDGERRAALARFADSLSDERTKDDILLIPSQFEITKTAYASNEATVIANLHFQYDGFTEIKEYTYYLSRSDRVWTIYDYAVRNLGTE